MSEFQYSVHAYRRAIQMGVTHAQLRACEAADPVPSRKFPDAYNFRSGDVTIGAKQKMNGDWFVTTVVWSHPEDWHANADKIGPGRYLPGGKS